MRWQETDVRCEGGAEQRLLDIVTCAVEGAEFLVVAIVGGAISGIKCWRALELGVRVLHVSQAYSSVFILRFCRNMYTY